MKTGILFDLDGTLLDTLADLADSVNHILASFGYPQRTVEEVRQFVGNGAARLIAQAVPEGANPAPVLAAFQPYYSAHCQIKTKPYEGIPEALAALRERYPLAIVSNKPDAAVKTLCADIFPGIYARGESPDCPRKPAADMVYKAMASLPQRSLGLPGQSLHGGSRREAFLRIPRAVGRGDRGDHPWQMNFTLSWAVCAI